MLTSIALGVTIFAASVGPAVSADTLTLNGFEYSPVPASTVIGHNTPIFAGIGALNSTFSNSTHSQSFTVYCADLFSIAGAFGSQFQYDKIDYSPSNFAGAIEPANITSLSKLFTFNSGPTNTSAIKSAGMQLAVWEILYDGNGTVDLTTGNFQSGTAPAAAVNWANILLAGAANSSPSYSVILFADEVYLRSPTHQNFITASPIPEPTSLSLIFAGICGIFGIARIKKSVSLD